MVRVLTYSVLLIVGMVLSQLPRHPSFEARDCSAHNELSSVHIDSSRMEFEIDKTDLRKYGIVYLVAMASRSFANGACKLQDGNSVILQSATYRTLPTYQKPIFFAVQQLALGLR